MIRKSQAVLICSLISSAVIVSAIVINSTTARAILISPRLGAPLRAWPARGPNDTPGPNDNLDQTFSAWVGTDPADVPVPASWLEKDNWKVHLQFSTLANCSPYACVVKSVSLDSNDFILGGVGDSSALVGNKIRLDFTLPASILPGLYHLHLTFNSATVVLPYDITPGKYIGPSGSASASPGAFTLSEANCVYVPWIRDGSASDSLATLATKLSPFSLIHITDIHTSLATHDLNSWVNEPAMDNLAVAIQSWGTDVVIPTGDITNGPGDIPEEYEVAYWWMRSLDVPVIMSNGNHDQGNLGLYTYYFGPQTSLINWGNVTFISFNSNIPMSALTVESIVGAIQASSAHGSPCFVACHKPLIDVFGRQAQGSAGAIVDALVGFGATATLAGHNHYNLVMDASPALADYLTLGDYDDAVHIPSRVGNEVPVGPDAKLITTTTAGKDARDNLQDIWPDYMPYVGYRRISLAGNQMANYTYDLDYDGKRDPSYSQPSNHLNRTFTFDADIGVGIAAGANLTIINNLTETISGARATFIVPNPPSGYKWNAAVGGSHITLRTSHANGTHVYLDFRLPVSRKSTVLIELLPELL